MDLWDRLTIACRPHQGLATVPVLREVGFSSARISRATRQAHLHRVARGVYSASPLPALPRHLVVDASPDEAFVLHVRAALLSGRPGALAATAGTAATLFGWGALIDDRGPLQLTVPHGSARAGGRHRVRQLRSAPVTLLDVLPGTHPLLVTTAVHTLRVRLPELDHRSAVVLLDSALRSGLVTAEDLQTLGRSDPGRPGAATVRRALAACDPAAGSVLESCARLDLYAAGLGGFETQHVLRDRLGSMRADFCWPGRRVVLEVDGARWHPDPHPDRRRDNRMARLGFLVVRLTWSEIMADPGWTRQVAEALSSPDRSPDKP